MTFALSFTPLWNRDERARYEPLASIDGALRGPLAATPDEPRSSIRDGEDEASAQLTSRMKAFLGGDERAFEALYRTLDDYTLADLVAQPQGLQAILIRQA